MSCQSNSLKGQFACICRAQKGREAFEDVVELAPDLSADWAETDAWRGLSEKVTGEPVICGGCKPWWTEAIKQARQEPCIS